MIGEMEETTSAAGAAVERRSGFHGNGMRETRTATSSKSGVSGGAAGAHRTNPFVFMANSLRELAEVLAVTTDEQYVRKPVGVIQSSVGSHVRHCLDHFEAFCSGASTRVMDYDVRARGTMVETDRSAALASIRRLQDQLALLEASMLTRTVRVTSMLAGDGTSIETPSSLGRELAFVLSHTVHHNALIAVMFRTLGVSIRERFGFAPSTIAHLEAAACAE